MKLLRNTLICLSCFLVFVIVGSVVNWFITGGEYRQSESIGPMIILTIVSIWGAIISNIVIGV